MSDQDFPPQGDEGGDPPPAPTASLAEIARDLRAICDELAGQDGPAAFARRDIEHALLYLPTE